MGQLTGGIGQNAGMTATKSEEMEDVVRLLTRQTETLNQEMGAFRI